MNLMKFLIVLLIFIMVLSSLTPITSSIQEIGRIDQPSKLPDWKDGEYHDYEKTFLKLSHLNETYPDFIDVFSIGKSVQDRDIWCIRITNEIKENEKYSCLITGCLHGNEWEGGEACLYFADYLLINHKSNESVKNILNTSEIFLIPLLNPDGREADTRWNDNGIDLNRNFDVHFGRLISYNYPLGKLFGLIKFPYIYFPLKDTYSTNCGKFAFSEPETSAVRDFMKSLDTYSFYLDCHTADHVFGGPGNITINPEFTVSVEERKILNYAIEWVNNTTEYEGIFGENFIHTGVGDAMEWVYYEYEIPSFCLELLSKEYGAWMVPLRHDNLTHWMKTGLPIFLYLVVNIENLYYWQTPDIQPILPEGIPPPPIQ